MQSVSAARTSRVFSAVPVSRPVGVRAGAVVTRASNLPLPKGVKPPSREPVQPPGRSSVLLLFHAVLREAMRAVPASPSAF